jgi:DNA polymerase III delta prime subunit
MMDIDDLIADAEAHEGHGLEPYGYYHDVGHHEITHADYELRQQEGQELICGVSSETIAVADTVVNGHGIPDCLLHEEGPAKKIVKPVLSTTASKVRSQDIISLGDAFPSSVDSKKISAPHQLALTLQRLRNGNDAAGSSAKSTSCSTTSEFELATLTEQKMHHISTLEKSTHLVTTPPVEGDYITCVLPNGSLHYVRQLVSKSRTTTNSFGRSGSGFLSLSIEELLSEAEALQAQALLRKADREQKLNNRVLAEETITQKSASGSNQMWVDKYSPKSFSQLLSSDSANREVLKSLKQWDPFVFKRAGLAASDDSSTNKQGTQTNTKFTVNQQSGNTDRVQVSDDKEDSDSSDDDEGSNSAKNSKAATVSKVVKVMVDTRPTEKVILLSGPPGTGKTTLAHIIAKHCGYNPLEVNASDDRSAESLRELMSRAMMSHTILPNGKPNCLILDEVDGIDGSGAMEALLNVINAPLGKDAASKGKGRKSNVCLTRPLICICNDHYTPSLRALRPIAKVFVMDPPTEAKLVQRLKNITSKEGLQLSTQSLIDLCGATGHDIRSSINTLQFASLKAAGDGTVAKDMSNAVTGLVKAGLKDGQKNIFQIWQETFNTKELSKSMAARQGTQFCGICFVLTLGNYCSSDKVHPLNCEAVRSSRDYDHKR